jgi:hypothetical protein
LLDTYGVEALGMLVLDAEGHDCALLLAFPFHRVRPRFVQFERGHCDGPFSAYRPGHSSPIYDRTVALLRAHGYEEAMPNEASPHDAFFALRSDVPTSGMPRAGATTPESEGVKGYLSLS